MMSVYEWKIANRFDVCPKQFFWMPHTCPSSRQILENSGSLRPIYAALYFLIVAIAPCWYIFTKNRKEERIFQRKFCVASLQHNTENSSVTSWSLNVHNSYAINTIFPWISFYFGLVLWINCKTLDIKLLLIILFKIRQLAASFLDLFFYILLVTWQVINAGLYYRGAVSAQTERSTPSSARNVKCGSPSTALEGGFIQIFTEFKVRFLCVHVK